MTNEHFSTEELRKADFGNGEKPLDLLGFGVEQPGQSYPRHYPQPNDALGEPLAIRDAARLLGCSPWTVRHSYIPRGLPYLRSGPLGKLIFYRAQLIRWILEHQRKGGR
ncbi:MAG: hypothetical protein ABSD39_20470 [Terriglobales bacterium]|jgi:hypothetical protein